MPATVQTWWCAPCWLHYYNAPWFICYFGAIQIVRLLTLVLYLNFLFSSTYFMPLVLWCCWMGGRRGIWPVKSEWWDAGMVICLGEVQICIWPSWCHCHSPSLAPVISRLVLLLWYELTRVILDKFQRAVKWMCVCFKYLFVSLINYFFKNRPIPFPGWRS